MTFERGAMEAIDIDAASTQLTRLIDAAARGEDVVFVRAGMPVARLVPVAQAVARPRRVLGSLAGRMRVPVDFDAPLPDDVLDLFEGR